MPQLRLGMEVMDMEVMAADTEDMVAAMEAIEPMAMERGLQKLKLMLSQDISEVDMAVMAVMVDMEVAMEDMAAMDVVMDMVRGLLMLRP